MIRKISLLLFTVIFTLLFSEVVVRILKIEHPKQAKIDPVKNWIRIPEEVWIEYDPDLGWFHQKNKRATLKSGKNLDVKITTNDQGFRGVRNYRLERNKGLGRILMLGDSFTFGWGVKDHETWTYQLESKYKNLEVINLGVAGYGIDQFLLVYQKIGKQFKPDYVFIGIYQEDFWRATRAFTDAGYGKPFYKLSKTGELILQNVPVPNRYEQNVNQFPPFIEHGFIKRILNESVLYRLIRKAILRLSRDLNLIDPNLTPEWQLGKTILKELIKEIRSNGSVPVILIIPPKQWLTNTKPTSVQRSLYRLADNENVDLIDFTDTFIQLVKREGLEKYYINGDWHWTFHGHKLAASAVAKYLTDKKYLS